jgi:2-polyprenyl-6-methoxyphenol hydroxylase-like FAD-dependent oxidoreductase
MIHRGEPVNAERTESKSVTQAQPQHRHAIVIGGSIAGLLAARVLTDHFETVTLIERDRFPEGPNPRPGVPQALQVHGLLKKGQEILEKLFPGIQDELVAGGATLVDMAAQPWYTPAGWGVQFDSEFKMISCSRSFLEWTIRQRVLQLPTIQVIQAVDVKGLLPNADRTGVQGVTFCDRHSTGPSQIEPRSLLADLVVDASGRRSIAPQWLTQLGYPTPQETVINAHLGYASRIYKLSPQLAKDWQILFMQAAPPHRTLTGAIFPIEGDRVLVGIVGGDHQYPAANAAEFLAYTQKLPSPLLWQTIQSAEPLSPIHCHRGTENRLRHYEKLSRWPEGFVILGDAVCAFNPVYGQGMTIAAMGAMTLDAHLQVQSQKYPTGSLIGMAHRFQKALAKLNAIPWSLATSEDYRYRTTEGGTPSMMTRFMHRYMDLVTEVATYHIPTRQTLMKVFNLIQSPLSVFHPRILLQLLKHRFPISRKQKTLLSTQRMFTE